jgi:hypothetical protein
MNFMRSSPGWSWSQHSLMPILATRKTFSQLLLGLLLPSIKKGFRTYCARLWKVRLLVALCWYTKQVEPEETTHFQAFQICRTNMVMWICSRYSVLRRVV